MRSAASRTRDGAVAGWLAGSIVLHAGLGLALVALPRNMPQEAPDRQVALVWTEQGSGAGDTEDSAGAAPRPEPLEAPRPEQAARPEPEATQAAAPDRAPQAPMERDPAPLQAVPENEPPAMAEAALPLPPPPAPRLPAAPTSAARQAPASNPAGVSQLADSASSQAGGAEASGPVIPPRRLGQAFNAPPAYPSASRIRNEQGRVTLTVQIGPTGAVTEAAVQVSAGYPALDRAALEAVRNWRFEPALRDGRPVSFVTSLHISFQLEGGLRW